MPIFMFPYDRDFLQIDLDEARVAPFSRQPRQPKRSPVKRRCGPPYASLFHLRHWPSFPGANETSSSLRATTRAPSQAG